MADLRFNYEDLWFIQTRGPDDKRPEKSWGGYSQDFSEADHVYTAAGMNKMPGKDWAICGIQNREHTELSLLVFDLDIHKAGPEFDPNSLTIDSSTLPVVKSQNGGFHVYIMLHQERGSGNEDDFVVPHDLDWDVDIRGSYVKHHVVAPNDVPGVGGSYELVQDNDIPGFFEVEDALDRIRYQGEPLIEHSPDSGGDYSELDFNRSEEPPADMPRCYARGLELRGEAPDQPDYNSHRVNVLTALCGLAAGYSIDEMVDQWVDEYPPGGNDCDADREKTRYQLEHIASKMDRGDYSPPSIESLEKAGILEPLEECECSIPYHGDSDDEEGLSDEATWEWWADERTDGDLGQDSVIPNAALRHIAREHTDYDLETIPDEKEDLPWLAINDALSWLRYEWGPEELGIDPDDDDDDREVTARGYARHDEDDVYSWEAVRRVYGDSKDMGRYAAVNLLRQHYEFLTPEDTEDLHVYNPDFGVYEKGAKYDIGRELDRELGQYYSTHEKNEILSRLKEVTVERDELEARRFDGQYLCVENGVLDIDSRELLDHDPKWLFTRRLPVSYDEEATCPEIQSFLKDITRRDADWKTMVEMVGNALLPHYKYESFLVLFGRGANGKSTWYNVVRDFLGHDNIQNITLQKLTDRPFAASNLLGQWANIGEDLPNKKIRDMGMLKDLTDNGETWVEPKGKQGFNINNRAKLMFAANEPPVLGERSHAVARRILPIRLPNRYTADPEDEHKDRDEDILDDMTTEEELSGLLNLALDGIRRLQDDGDFSLPESPQERLEYYEQYSDHIKMFAVNCLENEGGEEVEKDEVYNAYTDFCEEKARHSVSRQVFWDQLGQTTLDISIRRPQRPNGDRPRVCDNMTFTDHGKQFASNYDTPDYEVPTLSTVAPGDEGVTVEGRVLDVDTDQPDALAEKAKLQDVTGQVTVSVWAEANKPALEEGQAYRFKNVSVTEYEGHREIQVNEMSGVEELSDGVGNVPAADPGNNEQLGTAADGGEVKTADTEQSTDTDSDGSSGSDETTNGDGDILNLKPQIVRFVDEQQEKYADGVPEQMIIGEFVTDGHDPGRVTEAIETAKHKDGTLTEPADGHYKRGK